MPVLDKDEIRLLAQIQEFAKDKRVCLYVVGGYLRDILLRRKKPNPDMDFCLKRGAVNFGRGLARKLKGGFVVLDKEHGCCRIVKRLRDKICTLDFADFRGNDIRRDLLLRDFTINALAVPLKDCLAGCLDGKTNFSTSEFDKLVIDPCEGRKDIAARLIRMADKRSFDDDPLRILRAFSLSAIFGFRIQPQTLRSIRSKRKLLAGVSFERIRDELFKVLDCDHAYDQMLAMDKQGVLREFLPEVEIMRGVEQGPYHHLDVLGHAFETLKQLEMLINASKRNKDIVAYLDEVISSERKRSALLKLGALLHDVGKPQARRREKGRTKFHGHERIGFKISEVAAKRMKLSNDEIARLIKMVFWHLRPGYLADNLDLTPRAIFRFFRDAGSEGASILLLSLADQRATRGPLTTDESRQQHEKVVGRLIKEYFRRKKEKKLPRLINGNDLMKKFKLQPSPLIGEILSEIEELQAIGKIKNTKSALREAARFIKNKKSK